METDRTKLTELTGESFGANLISDMFNSSMNTRGNSEAPWETVAYYVIELENRIKNIENEQILDKQAFAAINVLIKKVNSKGAKGNG